MKNWEYNRHPYYMMDWSIYKQESYDAYEEAECAFLNALRREGLSHEETERILRGRNRLPGGYWDIELDMSAPEGLPDGEYTIYDEFTSEFSGYHYGEGHGAIVKDGQFEPASTDNACYAAVCQYYGADPMEIVERTFPIDHIYIEGFSWDAEKQMIRLIVGS